MHYVQVKGILSAQSGMNLYRGCQHGCIYCDSRSRCYQMDHRFEDIAVKENGLTLLEEALRRKRKPCMIATGSMSDPYMPLERELRYTRRALELILRYGCGATFITKSTDFLEDLPLLRRLHAETRCVVQMTLTTMDDTLCKILEPNAPTTRERAEALKILRDEGIPTVVWLCPILPLINDTQENLTGILDCCAESGVHGIINFGMGVTLQEGNREYFYQQLDRQFPGLKEEYIRRYGLAYALSSPNHRKLEEVFHTRCERYGILHSNEAIFEYLRHFQQAGWKQLSLFD